jgi:hypothetical protein
MTHLVLVPMHTCFLCLSIHLFVPHLINQDQRNLCVKISQISTWICVNLPPIYSTVTQDLNCTSIGWYYSLGGTNENGHVIMPQRENMEILDATPMTLALCFMFCKCTKGKWGGGGGCGEPLKSETHRRKKRSLSSPIFFTSLFCTTKTTAINVL